MLSVRQICLEWHICSETPNPAMNVFMLLECFYLVYNSTSRIAPKGKDNLKRLQNRLLYGNL